MEGYDQLLFFIGQLQAACLPLWPEVFHPWPAIFMADYLRGTLAAADFLQMFSLPGNDYITLGECIVETVEGKS